MSAIAFNSSKDPRISTIVLFKVMSIPKADLDTPWKDILRAYLPQGIEFFFPDLSHVVNWARSPEFLDKEFQQIAKDSDIGRRFADQLIKIWLKDGDELWLLLHLEVQAHREQNFSERMFTYSLRIFDRFGRIPVSLAILCDESLNWRPNRHRVELPYTVHDFTFGVVKLLDYRMQWPELESSKNPFSTVVMAHLKMLETKPDEQQRKYWKLSLIRGLYDKGYGKQEIINLYRFIDWVMILPTDLEQECWNELKAFEEERKMTYVTTGERIGYERGKEEGIESGRKEAGFSLLLRILSRKFEDIPSNIQTQIRSLSIDELENLGESIFDFKQLSDLENWLSDRI